MTREEVIRIAQGLITEFKCESETMVDFCNTIIKELQQEPCGDAISRQKVLDVINLNWDYRRNCIKAIEKLPPVNPQLKYEDIAKAFQFGLALGFGEKHDEMDKVIDEIKKVITPEPRMGQWVAEDRNDRFFVTYECSCCKREIIIPYESQEDLYKDYPYCHCGAKMEEQERWLKGI